MAGAMWCCAVVIADTDRDRLCAALEVRTYRSGEDAELILICRFYADNCVASEHVRTNVKSCTGAIRRNVSFICSYSLNDCVYETLLREYRHLQSLTGTLHTLSVQIRAERNDVSVFRCVSFHTLKTGLCVLQNACTLGNRYHRIGGQNALIPCTVFIICYKTLVGRNIAETDAAPVNIFLFHDSNIPFFLMYCRNFLHMNSESTFLRCSLRP